MKDRFDAIRASFQTRAFRAGGYSVISSVIVIAIAVILNLIVGKLPARMTQIDLSSDKLFTLSLQSSSLCEELYEPVTIYWIVTDSLEDQYLSRLLPLYAQTSTNLTVEKIDPVVYPTFVSAYTDATPAQNDLVVVSETRSCYVPYSSLYLYNYSNLYTNDSYDVQFAGESEITRAIDYVTTDTLSKVYLLTGHGEASLSATFSSGMRSLNLETVSLNLLTVDAVPQDADCILINNPLSDLTEIERDLLLEYLTQGGNLFVVTDCETDENWENLQAVTERYGLRVQSGIVIEGDTDRCMTYPYYLFPLLGDHAITQPISDSGYAVLSPFSGAIRIGDAPADTTVTPLLKTSDEAFLKSSGSSADTSQREPGDLAGPFVLSVAAENSGNGSHLVWCASAMLLDEETNAIASGANEDFFLNCLAWMCGHNSSISIHPKQMDSHLLLPSAGAVSKLGILLCFVIPAVFLGTGIAVVLKRRRR